METIFGAGRDVRIRQNLLELDKIVIINLARYAALDAADDGRRATSAMDVAFQSVTLELFVFCYGALRLAMTDSIAQARL